MTNQHPISPPLELQDKWRQDWYKSKVKHIQLEDHIATKAACWGADQELEACCEWLCPSSGNYYADVAVKLRAARRPKPPSLKEQALLELDSLSPSMKTIGVDTELLRRAIEALPND